ncbi:MAG: hypothetical protein QNK24_02295 [Desulfuromusa sp.]|nr:hypothetical protein [Desulfuromusa sp.]
MIRSTITAWDLVRWTTTEEGLVHEAGAFVAGVYDEVGLFAVGVKK